MAGFPWPLDGVQNWFEGLWNWISTAAVNAVSVVSKWITNAVSELWTTVSGAFASLWTNVKSAFSNVLTNLANSVLNLWTVISSSINGLWKSIETSLNLVWSNVSTSLNLVWSNVSGAFSNLWTNLTNALSLVQTGLISFFTNMWNSLSGAIGAVGNTLGGAITNGFAGIAKWADGVAGNIERWANGTASGIAGGVSQVLGAVGGAVNTIGGWVSDLLKGMGDALGKAVQGAINYLWTGLQAAAGAIATGLNEYVVKPLMGVFNWIRDTIFGILRSLWSSIQGVFGGHSPITPEEAAGFTVPLLLMSSGAGFGVSVMGAVGELQVLGSGLKATAITDFVKDAFAMADISRSLIMPIFNAAYAQPVQYYYNAMYRPRIPDTRTADQMLFEEHISEPEWRQIYRYNGWKEQHIDAWFKTMWREPSLLVLRNLVLDPDVDEAWVRKKMREGGLIGEDADAIISYGRRQSLRDERSALATQVQTDFIDGVIVEADARADLDALKFSPGEIDYRIARCEMIVARNERRATLKAAKNLTESDLKTEVALGLRSHGQFIGDMQTIGFSAAIAERKYVLITTPKPLTATEIERRRTVVQDKIVKTTRRFDMLVAREDLQTGMISDLIEYLNGLEKPPFTRIASLTLQLNKMADEKQLILEERDAELADLQAELSLIQAG